MLSSLDVIARHSDYVTNAQAGVLGRISGKSVRTCEVVDRKAFYGRSFVFARRSSIYEYQ
jgi:hypothetical protein